MYLQTTLFVLLVTVSISLAGHHDKAHYKFAYGVHDPHTHDKKSQHEERHGHNVKGGYDLKEPDGTHRIVKYVSGPHSGFEAIVERHGIAHHPGHYDKHGKGYGKGGVSWVSAIHWGNQGAEEKGHGHGHGHGYDHGHGLGHGHVVVHAGKGHGHGLGHGFGYGHDHKHGYGH